MSNPNALVQKLWNYCNILRDDGLNDLEKSGGSGVDLCGNGVTDCQNNR